MENTENTTEESTGRPLGFWLRVVDARLDEAFADAVAAEGVDRRDWMLLNALAGTVDAPWLAAKAARGGRRIRAFAERGWVVREDGTWSLTDEGRAAHERLGALVDGIRTRVAGAVTPEDLATTLASLEAIAAEFGGAGTDRPWRRRGPGFGPRGFGRGGFGPGQRDHGFGPRHGQHGHGHHGRGHGEHGFGPGHGCGPRHRGEHHGDGPFDRAEDSYARGFTTGFAEGRRAASGAA